ncbi:hypothetical protein SSIL_0247 [Solibacillus silvestris StLB046]|uniref:Uncharacterized protein n=1 Tax=Solibacillus silvestris (strain StLB046) TaxID=1002809 RepID=F2F4D6_SOLSS|nr:hypothetical protein SSIL_0247 [Solibacillus silvestris StLB046]
MSGSPVEPAPLFYINKIDLYDIIKLSVMMSGVVNTGVSFSSPHLIQRILGLEHPRIL